MQVKMKPLHEVTCEGIIKAPKTFSIMKVSIIYFVYYLHGISVMYGGCPRKKIEGVEGVFFEYFRQWFYLEIIH